MLILSRGSAAEGRLCKPVAVLNLNPFAPLYIVRHRDDRFLGDKDLVARIEADTTA
jgi:hypothetical protein